MLRYSELLLLSSPILGIVLSTVYILPSQKHAIGERRCTDTEKILEEFGVMGTSKRYSFNVQKIDYARESYINMACSPFPF